MSGKVKYVLAVICPGQGSQTPGMLTPWLDIPGVSDFLFELETASGVALREHGTTSDAETIKDTAVAQPLIVASSLIASRQIFGSDTSTVSVTAGHSVGEFAAVALAGVLTPAKAVELVSHRARFMKEAALATESGMAAVVGGDSKEVKEAIEAAGAYPANMNSAQQTVAAGSPEALAKLAANAPAKTRVISLAVAGAFHTPFMASAQEQFLPLLSDWEASSIKVPLLTNSDGSVLTSETSPQQVLSLLGKQITNPVRWDLCQETLQKLGVNAVLELAPGGVLTGLAKRAMPGVASFAVKSAEDIEAAKAFVSEHK